MTWKARLGGLLCCLLLTLSAGGPSHAQDDEAETERKALHLYAEVGTWVAQAAGLEFEPVARIDLNDPFGTEILKMSHGTQGEGRYRFGVDVGKAGGVLFTWYSHAEDEVMLGDTRPNEFVFAQLLSFPRFAGFSNDGLADGFDAEAASKLRDFRADYYRTAFKNDRIDGRWFVGVRRVQHERSLTASYYTLEPLTDPPLIPPFVDPRPDLAPLTETALISSDYTGRGIEAGLEVDLPLISSGKLLIEGSLALSALRGKTNTTYRGTNAFYVLVDSVTREREPLAPPYEEFGQTEVVNGLDVPLINRIQQDTQSFGLKTVSRSTGSDVIDASFGMRWRAWNGLEVFGGFRSTHYENVGVDLRPDEGSASEVGLNLQAVTEVHRSVTYEGFYGGIAWRF